MRRWLIWAGIAIILGGGISLAMTMSVEGEFDPREGFISYSIGWILAGIVVMAVGFVLKSKKSE